MIFFPIVVLIYFVIPVKLRYIWLLITSYYFYMSWNPKYAILILVSTIITYISGLLLDIFGKDGMKHSRAKKRITMLLCLLINIGILAYFKYFDFILSNINTILSRINMELLEKPFDVILPVGISFYTFQALSYTIDIYRGEIKAEKNFAKYALFVSFFPQLVAGPIERSKNLLHQINEKHVYNYDDVRKGLLLMLFGLFQKMVIADRAAILVNEVYNHYQKYLGLELVVATLLFAIQIYCDFAGYSNVAIGSAKVLGFSLMENFNAPYLSRSISEYWRRWHISLSTWFRDYLYIPLGGNRCSKLKKYFNLMVTFLVSGLWHGASWHFVVWGGLNGLFQIIGDLLKPLREKGAYVLKLNRDSLVVKLIQTLMTFILINFTWIFFRADNVMVAIQVIKRIFRNFNIWIFWDGSIFQMGLDRQEFTLLLFAIGVITIYDICKYCKISLYQILLKQQIVVRWALYYMMIFSLIIYGTYGNAYDIQDFIYFQF